MRREEKCYLPTPEQDLLIRFILSPDSESLPYWEQWKLSVHFDDTDYASLLMLPLAYKKLLRLGASEPLLKRIKGIYRFFWVQNQKILQLAKNAIPLLEQEGISSLVMKGACLALEYYPDPGTRPMGDLDLLIPEDKVVTALQLLRKHGWFSQSYYKKLFIPSQHAVQVQSPQKGEMDLHWHLFRIRCNSNSDQPFWDQAVPFNVLGAKTKTLSTSDHLFHICVHGSVWVSDQTPLRLITDAYYLFKKGPIDPDRIVFLAKKLELSWHVAECLQFLKDSYDLPVPPELLDRLYQITISSEGKKEFLCNTQSYGFMGEIPSIWYRYLVQNQQKTWVGCAFRFPFYLRDFYGFKSLFSFTRYLFNKGWQKYRGRNQRLPAKPLPAG